MKFTVIIEKGEQSFGAYAPDLPGCVAAGETEQEALDLIKQAIEFHLEGLRQEGQTVPEPHFISAIVDVTAA